MPDFAKLLADREAAKAAQAAGTETQEPVRRPAFIGRAETQAREAARLAQIDALKTEVAKLDAEPAVPGEKFNGGEMYEGFYAGMVVAQTENYIAIWSKMAGRVAILPKARIKTDVETGAIVAMHAWGSRLVRVVELTAQYGWLDAFDDFAVEFQRTDRDWRMSLAIAGLCTDCFVVDGSRKVASWVREYEGGWVDGQTRRAYQKINES